VGATTPQADAPDFEVRVSVSPPRVSPGAETAVTLELVNRSAVPASFAYEVDCIKPEVQAYRGGASGRTLRGPRRESSCRV